MEIKDVKEKKNALEQKITDLVQQFSSETGLEVDGISLHMDTIRCERGIIDYRYKVYCDVRV